jgi:hypothetical protein
MTSCHNLQADVPLENVLAFYEIGKRRTIFAGGGQKNAA